MIFVQLRWELVHKQFDLDDGIENVGNYNKYYKIIPILLFINTTAEVTKYKKLYIKFKLSSTVLVNTQISHKAVNKTKTGRGQKNMVDVALLQRRKMAQKC